MNDKDERTEKDRKKPEEESPPRKEMLPPDRSRVDNGDMIPKRILETSLDKKEPPPKDPRIFNPDKHEFPGGPSSRDTKKRLGKTYTRGTKPPPDDKERKRKPPPPPPEKKDVPTIPDVLEYKLDVIIWYLHRIYRALLPGLGCGIVVLLCILLFVIVLLVPWPKTPLFPATATPTPTSTPTSTPTPASVSDTIKTPVVFVSAQRATIDHGVGQSKIIVDLNVVGADPIPLPDADVTVSMTRPDGTSETLSTTTDQAGDASLTFTIFVYGSYTIKIESLAVEGYEYDPTLNIATSMIVEVGSTEGLAAVGSERIAVFFEKLNSAFKSGDTAWLFNALHPAVLDLYGSEACQAYLTQAVENPLISELRTVGEFGSWTWERDGRSILVLNAYTTEIETTSSDGAGQVQEVHLALREDGSLSWFTDCGEPLP